MYRNLLILLPLLTGLLAACGTPSTDTSEDLSPLKEAAWFINQENHRLMQRMQREVETSGNRARDVAEKQKAEALLRQRQAHQAGDPEAADYVSTLARVYEELNPQQNEQTSRLRKLQESSPQQGDSLAYHQYWLQLLLLENEVLNGYARRLAPGNVLHPPSWQLIKPIDTLALGGVYEFSIIPAAYDFTSTQIRADSSLSIRHNGKDVAIQNRLWLKSGVLLGEVQPLEAGTYSLSGQFELYNPLFGVRIESDFTDSFVVK